MKTQNISNSPPSTLPCSSATATTTTTTMGIPGGGGDLLRRDWSRMYAIYGLPDRHRRPLLVLLTSSFLSASVLTPLLLLLGLPVPASLSALLSLLLLLAASDILHSSLPLHWRMCQRVVSSVPLPHWPSVRRALGLEGGDGGRGVLLASVALRLRDSGSPGRVVGLAPRPFAALRAALAEGVADYVTCCREAFGGGGGGGRRLPFGDGYFDVVVAAVGGGEGEEAAEMVRVLRGGGWGVVWDARGEGLARELRGMGMEDVRVSERVKAYMSSTHIVSFRKPLEAAKEEEEEKKKKRRKKEEEVVVDVRVPLGWAAPNPLC